jgi:hypothetical protein
MHLLTTYSHHSELQVITALSQISTINRSPQHSLSDFPACCQFNSRFLATLLKVEILQLPALTSLLPGEYPATELLSTVNPSISTSLLSLPCRARLNCQLSTELSHLPTNYFTSLIWTASAKVKVMLRPTVSTHLGLTTRSWLLSDSCGFVDLGRPL